MSKIILVGFGWGLAFAVSFVVLGYPTFLSLLFGILGGWAWSEIATYWTSEDEVQGLPSYLDDISALREELSNIGTGGRIDLRKAQRRRDAKASRLLRQEKLRQQQLRHRGRPTTLRDRLTALRSRLMPPKKKGGGSEAAEEAALMAQFEAQLKELNNNK
jgi:hypothetical protein